MGRAVTMMPPRLISRSVSTHTSMGSPSPATSGRPARDAANAPTASPQSVRGTKPYSAGQSAENFCGRSTRRWPESLSTSYFTVSVGTISM